MCKDCGCMALKDNAHIEFMVSGYTEEKVREVERSLLGLKGVMAVHIHANSGATQIDYNPQKTKIVEIISVFEGAGLEASL